LQSLIANEDFQHILRVLNTNVDGRQKIMFALTSIKGVGRRFANLVCKKADVDMSKRYVVCSLWVRIFISFFSFCILLSMSSNLTVNLLNQLLGYVAYFTSYQYMFVILQRLPK
jgi:hypothetical protein